MTKLVQALLYPFNIAIALMALTLYFLRKERSKPAFRCIAVALALIVIPAIPILSHRTIERLENGCPVQSSLADYPAADVIIVLGGTMAPVLPPRNQAEELFGSRILMAARLFREKKAPWVIASSGSKYVRQQQQRTEADDMADLLVEYGVPRDRIIAESVSRNTYENGLESKKIMETKGFKNALLVTSAFHCSRSKMIFEKIGLAVTPVPSSFLMPQASDSLHLLLPNIDGQSSFQRAYKEWLGTLFYRIYLFFDRPSTPH